MADEAFALSPINARASLPTDADYDAIHEAFMETARGRWFLGEYAKRNRNADTRMVLDAVARIEATLVGHRQTQAEPAATEAAAAHVAAAQVPADAQPQIDVWPELASAFARARIEIAQRLVHESNDEAFETIRASTETLKSISWALRERGFDSRICDFLDIQVNKITDGFTGLMAESSVAGETEAGILAAFDELMQHVEGRTSRSDSEMETLDVMVDAVADAMNEDDFVEAMLPDDDDARVATAMVDEAVAALVETLQPEAPAVEPEPAVSSYPDAEFHAIYGDDSDIEIVDAPIDELPALAALTEPEINRQRLYEAKLEPYRPISAIEAHARAAAAAADIEIVDIIDTEPDAPGPRVVDEPAPQVVEIAVAATIDQAPGKSASLGEALIASGVIPHPAGSRPDPLGPFRRMSQAEKIAFFT